MPEKDEYIAFETVSGFADIISANCFESTVRGLYFILLCRGDGVGSARKHLTHRAYGCGNTLGTVYYRTIGVGKDDV